jgi:ABC-type methionine transport system permease subunit
MQNAGLIPFSARAHDETARAVERGDVEAAASLVEKNWRLSMGSLLPWLEADGR